MRTIGGTSGDTQQLYCVDCGQMRLFQNDLAYTSNMGVCFALSVVTCGLFLPVWIWVAYHAPPNRYQCRVCGHYLAHESISGVKAP